MTQTRRLGLSRLQLAGFTALWLQDFAVIPALAQPVSGLEAPGFGERFQAAVARIGMDWRFERSECGPPRYNRGVCVWLSGGTSVPQARFSLVTQDAGPLAVPTATSNWTHRQDRQPGEEKVFRALCLALVATALPDTLDSKLRQIAGELTGNARGSGELAVDRVQFYRNASADGIACEVIPKFD